MTNSDTLLAELDERYVNKTISVDRYGKVIGVVQTIHRWYEAHELVAKVMFSNSSLYSPGDRLSVMIPDSMSLSELGLEVHD